MADILGNVQSTLEMGKAVYDWTKKVNQIPKNRKELENRLDEALKRVQKLQHSAASSSDGTDGPSFGDDALKRLHRFILDAKKFTKKVANKKYWKKFVQANDITGKFDSMNQELRGL